MKGKLINVFFILLGNIIAAFGISAFVLNNHMISGGVTGIGIIFNHFANLNISMVIAIINIGLFFIGLFFIGKQFALSTLISTFTFPVFLEFFNTHAFFSGYINDILLASILGGCLLGIGTGLMIRHDASSGGLDVIAIVINKKFGVPVFVLVNIFDFSILCLQTTFSDPTIIIYSLIFVFVTSFMLNRTLTKGSKMVQLVIISDAHEAIKQMIIEEADAGVTSLYSQKGLSETDTKTLLTIIPPVKLNHIKEQIKLIDPVAFMVVATVDEVSGRGYTIDRH